MATYAKYLDKYQHKKQTTERPPADQETYIGFLEVQLEKVSQALMSAKTFDERLDQALGRFASMEEKTGTMMKLVKMLQSTVDSQELENAQIREKVNTSIGEFNRRLTKCEFAESTAEFEARMAKLERKIEKTQGYLEENLGKIDDQFFLQKSFKEYERNFEQFEQRVQAKLQEKNGGFEGLEKLVKEAQGKLEEKMDLELKRLGEGLEAEKKERISGLERLQTQNFQREQILSNLTDDLMSKLENLETSKSQENQIIENLRSKIKGTEENFNKEMLEIKNNMAEMGAKLEKSVKSLDKTFSFQDPGVTRRDFEDLERRIGERIEEHLARNSALMLESLKKTDLAHPKKKTESPIMVLSEISPNKFGVSTDSELDKVLFKKTRKSRDKNAGETRAARFIEKNLDLLSASNEKGHKSSRSPSDLKNSSMKKTRSFSRSENEENKIISPIKSSASRKRSNSKENPNKNRKNQRICEVQKDEKVRSGKKLSPNLRNSESGSSYTKSLKYDMNFSNSGVRKKKDALISEKYRKLEKIYESLSKE